MGPHQVAADSAPMVRRGEVLLQHLVKRVYQEIMTDPSHAGPIHHLQPFPHIGNTGAIRGCETTTPRAGPCFATD